MKSIMRLLSVTALLFASTAIADEAESDDCLRTKIWEGYSEGWAVRTATNTELAQGETKIYLVTLYAGNRYKFLVCGDESAVDLDLRLHDGEGEIVQYDATENAEPTVEFVPTRTDTYYVAVVAEELEGETGSVAMAVTYQ